MVVLFAEAKIKPEAIQQAIENCTAMLEPSRAENGCHSYTFYCQSESDPTITFFEEWESRAILDAHFETEHFKNFQTVMADCFAAPPKIAIYEVTGVDRIS